jgi:flagellum-specific ATP synthase
VTAFYSVLTEGDDTNDPIADTVRGLVDGHVVLDRALAHRGQYPAIDVVSSLSRLAACVTPPEANAAAQIVRRAVAALLDVRDLVELGAYVAGINPVADAALRHSEDIEAFLCQHPTEATDATDVAAVLFALAEVLA